MFGKYRVIVLAVLILVLLVFGLILFADNAYEQKHIKESFYKSVKQKNDVYSNE